MVTHPTTNRSNFVDQEQHSMANPRCHLMFMVLCCDVL